MQINSNKKTTIIERISYYLEKKGITAYRFCKDLGFSNGFLDKHREITTDKYANILGYYPDLNPQWLLTGEGEMLKDNIPNKSKIPEMEAYSTKANKGIPLVDPVAVGEFGNSHFAIKESDVKDYYIIPKFKNRHIDFMIEVAGSSMYPKYASGDIVACTIINKESFIQWGKVHVIGTREQGLLIKRLYKNEITNCIVCHSDNEKYPPFDVGKDEITGVALVVGVIRLE